MLFGLSQLKYHPTNDIIFKKSNLYNLQKNERKQADYSQSAHFKHQSVRINKPLYDASEVSWYFRTYCIVCLSTIGHTLTYSPLEITSY